jgi:hypothetical protein
MSVEGLDSFFRFAAVKTFLTMLGFMAPIARTILNSQPCHDLNVEAPVEDLA